jgi:hypothetical protein
MRYELWNAASGNWLATVDSLDELTAVVREYADLNGEGSIDDLFARGWPVGANAPARTLTPHDLLRVAQPLIRTRSYGLQAASPAVASGSSSRQVRYPPTAIAV